LSYLENAMIEEAVPAFYAEQLIEKLKKLPGKDQGSNVDFKMA
jgi:hypothetical protein